MEVGIGRIIVIVMDGVGVGELPDAYLFDDRGANTLGNLANAVPGMKIPNLVRLGLPHLTFMKGLPREEETTGFYGKMAQRAWGKDSICGHWELMGVAVEKPFVSYPHGLPAVAMQEVKEKSGKDFLGNSGDLAENFYVKYAEDHLQTGKPMLIMSRDSEVHIYCHESKMPAPDFFLLGNNIYPVMQKYDIGRVYLRYFSGELGKFTSPSNPFAEYHTMPPHPTVLKHVKDKGIPVHTIGKACDLYESAAITNKILVENNMHALDELVNCIREGETNEAKQALVVATLHEFDFAYGHYRDTAGFAACLEEFDGMIPRIQRSMENEDVLIITADHGNDPTFKGFDHTREYVPVLIYSRMFRPKRKANLGNRISMADVAETIAEAYDLNIRYAANSFWSQMVAQL